MGYNSDVVLAFAFSTKAHLDEVLAVYVMDPTVQVMGAADNWQVHEWGDCWGLTFAAYNVKWYDGFDDVKAYNHMLTVVQMFADERSVDVGVTHEDGSQEIMQMFPYAYRMFRIGEDYNDIEYDHNSNDANLETVLYDRVGIQRGIVTDF